MTQLNPAIYFPRMMYREDFNNEVVSNFLTVCNDLGLAVGGSIALQIYTKGNFRKAKDIDLAVTVNQLKASSNPQFESLFNNVDPKSRTPRKIGTLLFKVFKNILLNNTYIISVNLSHQWITQNTNPGSGESYYYGMHSDGVILRLPIEIKTIDDIKVPICIFIQIVDNPTNGIHIPFKTIDNYKVTNNISLVDFKYILAAKAFYALKSKGRLKKDGQDLIDIYRYLINGPDIENKQFFDMLFPNEPTINLDGIFFIADN